MKKHRVEDPFVDVEDEEFLSQIAAAEAEALSGKRRKTAADDAAEGLYTAALKGSKSILWQQQQQKASAFNSGFSVGSDGVLGGGGALGGGGDSCFKCGKSGHWARDCDAASIGGAEALVPEKPCPCGLGVCLVLTANTEKNRGRKFYKCPNREENGGCGFFEWCDNSPNNNTMTGRIQNYTPASSFPDIACPCGAGSCLVLTAKTGKNIGEQFYKCPANQASSCGFFKWCNEKTIAAATPASAPKFVSNTSDTSNKTYAVKAGSSCFKCGKEGHWANNCPITSSDTYGGSGGKSTSSGNGRSCFKCGKEGHWANDCSVPSSNTYAGSGGKSTSSGTGRSCFKCGKEGHWANDCPVPSSNTYAGSRGKSTSPGTCYKCGKPGHWARECPQ